MRFFRQIGDLQGWKRFGFEVAVIAVGLSITLVAQELISNANRARVTREAMDAVEVELVTMLANTSERMAIEPCRREQTLALAQALEQPGVAWSFQAPEGINSDLDQWVLPAVMRTPARPWPDSSWRALLASDAATGMDRADFAALSAIYDTASDIREAQVEAWRLKARLSHLAVPGTLTDEQRREARAVLGELAAVERGITTNARNLREFLITFEFRSQRRLEVAFGRTIYQSFDDFVGLARPVYGACIDDAEYQPLYDHYNALTGENATIPPREAAPNRAAVDAGLREIRGTGGLRLRTRALREMVTKPALLARQSEVEREHFSALLDYLELFAEELRFYETHPLTQRIEDIPILRVGPQEAATFTYADAEYQRLRRPITLGVPVSQACRNTELIAAFFTWTRWQGNIPIFARQAQQEMQATQAFIAEQR